MTPDVYVLSDCAWRDGSEVVAVFADLDAAMQAADGPELADSQVPGWRPWRQSAMPGERRWLRDGTRADGSVHPSAYQEIVARPLRSEVP